MLDEKLLDGRQIDLCGVCRAYMRGLIQTCETCADCEICAWSGYGFNGTCDGWRDSMKRGKK